MREKAQTYAASLAELSRSMSDLAERIAAGAAALRAELDELAKSIPDSSSPEAMNERFNRVALFDGVRALYGNFDDNEVRAIDRAIDMALGLVVPAEKIGISPAAFEQAAITLEPDRLDHALAAIRAVDEVESGGGWFTDVRADILALDGPGGFLDGPDLPKILFEAHVFARNCSPKGKFNRSHPNLSSSKWNRALYVGGEAEYRRLHMAMQLDESAALMAASWGRYQILGENFRAAGFGTVQGFVAAMKESEERHLEAFVAFIMTNRLVNAFRRISSRPEDCAPFARGYNGGGYAANNYHGKIAAAFGRWSKKLRSS